MGNWGDSHFTLLIGVITSFLYGRGPPWNDEDQLIGCASIECSSFTTEIMEVISESYIYMNIYIYSWVY